MIPENIKKTLTKQHYKLAGKHSAVQICRWTKHSLLDEGVCYKEKFYGIKSHLCCQMTPSVMWCPNKCLHCWRAIELTLGEKIEGEIDSPSEIIDECIKAQKKLLTGFKSNKKINLKKLKEAQEPTQFAISLSGEPMIYEKIGELIEELRRRGKTSFLVTNGLYPEKILELKKKNQLPTQLYVSVNAPNKKLYEKIHRSVKKNAWEKLNKTLEILPTLKCRIIFRMNLIRDLNMVEPENYAQMIKKASGEAKPLTASSKSRRKPTFVEIKGFMSVGFARERLGYEKMPTNKEMEEFIELLLKELGKDWKLLDSHEFSRAYVLGRDKKNLKIKKSEI